MTIKEQDKLQELLELKKHKEEIAEREYELLKTSNQATKVFKAKQAYYEAMAETNGVLQAIAVLEEPEEE